MRSFSAVGHRENLRKRMATGCGPVLVVAVGSWPSLALLFTYRAEVRVGGTKIMHLGELRPLKAKVRSLILAAMTTHRSPIASRNEDDPV